MELEQTLIEVWRQAMVDDTRTVKLGDATLSGRRTAKRGARLISVWRR
jgi:hypothetical protein